MANNQLKPGTLQEQLTAVGRNRVQVGPSVTAASIKAEPGRLCKVVVTTNMSAIATFFDNANGDSSGVVLGVIKSSAVAGDVIDFQMPAQNGIAVVSSGTGVMTVSYD